MSTGGTATASASDLAGVLFALVANRSSTNDFADDLAPEGGVAAGLAGVAESAGCATGAPFFFFSGCAVSELDTSLRLFFMRAAVCKRERW